MTAAELIWSFGMLGSQVVALQAFRRIRRKTSGFQEVRAYKGELPRWVVLFEKVTLYVLVLGFGASVFSAYVAVHAAARPGHPIAGATAIFAVLGAAMVAVPIAALGANGISWMLPPVRSANLHAMSGLHVSFAGMNKGLLLFGAVSVPLGCIELALAVVEPWAR
jgi:hypothetical protein